MKQRILEFHGIGEPARALDAGEDAYWLSIPQFETALDLVAAASSEKNPIVLTFDDGNRSDYDIALPRLLDRGLSASFFVLSGRLQRPCSLNPAHIAEMVSAGMRIGLHGAHHVSWRDCSEPDLDEETCTARAKISAAAERPVSDVAIPFGRYNGRVIRRLKREKFTTVYTSDGGTAGASSWIKPRLAVKRDTTPEMLAAMLSGTDSATKRGVRASKMLIKRWI